MKLKINDFKKAGYIFLNKFHAIKVHDGKYTVEINEHLINDSLTCTVILSSGIIPSISLQIDDIATVEEIENTVEEMYKAISSIKGDNYGK